MKPTNRLLYTVNEAAARLSVRPRTVRWLIRTQQLTAQRIGQELLIESPDLTAFIDAYTVPAHPEWAGGDDWR